MAPTSSAPSFAFPIAGPYSWGSPFGPRGGGFHNGVDLPAAVGTPLVAVTRGKVTFSSSGAGGLEANLDVGTTRYYMCHMAGQNRVHDGREVDAGTVLGTVGMTGNTTGPHLHFSLFRAGVAVDPTSFLRSIEGNSIAVPDADLAATPAVVPVADDQADGNILSTLADGRTWVRVLEVVIGIGLIVSGVLIITTDTTADALGVDL